MKPNKPTVLRMPRAWLKKPMSDKKLKRVCGKCLVSTVRLFPNDQRQGAKIAIDAVGNLMRHHGRNVETLGEIQIFLGVPISKAKLH